MDIWGKEEHAGKVRHHYVIINYSNLSCRKKTTNSITRKTRTLCNMAENCTFKTLYILNKKVYFNFFFLLTSLWWLLSETIIRYPIILKTKFGGNVVTSFPAKNAKIWKTNNVRFFGMVNSILLQNLKWIALKLKKTNKGRCFWCHICPPYRENREQIHQVAKVRLEPETTGLRVRRADHSATTDQLLGHYIKKPSNFSLALMSEKHNI